MLVFLSRAARTGRVAAHRRFLEVSLGRALRHRRLRDVERLRRNAREHRAGRGVDVGGVVVTRERVEMLGDEIGQDRRLRRLELDLRAHQQAGHFLADRNEQPLEQQEGLLLIFVDRLLLRIAAQVDDLAERVERRQMLLPMMVEGLDQDLPLDLDPALGLEFGGLGRHRLVGEAAAAVR